MPHNTAFVTKCTVVIVLFFYKSIVYAVTLKYIPGIQQMRLITM